MKILQCIGTLDPHYGGPVEALRTQGICFELAGHETTIMSLDSPGAPRVSGTVGNVICLGPSLLKYRLNPRALNWLIANGSSFDLIIVHGVWQFQSVAVWLASLRTKLTYMVFTHGALDPWFGRRYPGKHIKKKIYWWLLERKVLSRAHSVLFTAQEEMDLAGIDFPLCSKNKFVTGYGILDAPNNAANLRAEFHTSFPQLEATSKLLFLGRIHPKKGIEVLLEAFANLTKSYPSLSSRLVIAGPGNSKYRRLLEAKCASLQITDRVEWLGMLGGNAKWGAYYSAEVFVLTSHSENFGVVVAEALACSLPVIISNKVNTHREVTQFEAGLVANDDSSDTYRVLEEWMRTSSQRKLTMRLNARKCFESNFRMEDAARRIVERASQEKAYRECPY